MTDRELLELAAKAVGWDETRLDERNWFYVCTYPGEPREWELWDPLTDDGDALRLAIKLGLPVGNTSGGQKHPEWSYAYAGSVQVPHDGSDPCKAVRRAIVRAAAAVGEEMT
jgi:hypothetical protein